MTQADLISVVISFRNEEDIIAETIQRLEEVLGASGVDFEILFVNDASTDRSLDILKEKASENPRIKVITMSRRFGVDPCFVAGLHYSQGSAVIMMDCDLQDPPEVIPQLLDKWNEGVDVVHTCRRSRAGESQVKRMLTRWAYKVLRFAADDVDLPVEAGIFKLLSRRVVDEVNELRETDPYLRGLVPWVGFRHDCVFYDRDARTSGTSHFPLWSTGPRRTFLAGLLSFSLLPLHLMLCVGLVIALLGSVCLLFVLAALFIRGGVSLSVWILACVLFLGGLQLLGLGVLGLYLGRTYGQVKNRPLYIVESSVGFD